MNYFNYSISGKQGKFYLKSKTPQDGYVEVVYGPNKDKVTYHKYVNSIKGVVESFDVKEISFEGRTLRFLELTLKDGENLNKVSTNLKNTKGGYTDEARMMISAMRGLDKISESVFLNLHKSEYKNKKGETKWNLNLYINYENIKNEEGKALSTGYIPFSEVPEPEVKEIAGDTVYDWTPQTVFYYEEFLKIRDRFDNSTPVAEAKKEVAVEDDNLPF